MISVRSTNLRLEYQRFTPSGCKDIGFGKSQFVTKTQDQQILLIKQCLQFTSQDLGKYHS